MLVVPNVEIQKYNFTAVPNGITYITNSSQIQPAVFKLNHADRWTNGKTDMHIYIHSFHAHHAKNA
jgi:hypothetical protein